MTVATSAYYEPSGLFSFVKGYPGMLLYEATQIDGPPPLSAVAWPSPWVELFSSWGVGRASLVSSLEFLMSVDLLALVGTRPESTRTSTARLGHTVHLLIIDIRP